MSVRYIIAAQYAITAASLLTASIQDVRTRQVSDKIWLALALPSLILDLALAGRGMVDHIVSSALLSAPAVGVLILSWKLRLLGEADVLAYLSIGLSTPLYLRDPVLRAIPPMFSTLIYSKALVLTIPPIQLISNFLKLRRDPSLLEGVDEPVWKIIIGLALLTTRPGLGAVPAEEVRDGRRKLNLSRVLSPLEARVPDESCRWFVPAYPLMPLILLGYLLSLAVGDPLTLLAGVYRP